MGEQHRLVESELHNKSQSTSYRLLSKLKQLTSSVFFSQTMSKCNSDNKANTSRA